MENKSLKILILAILPTVAVFLWTVIAFIKEVVTYGYRDLDDMSEILLGCGAALAVTTFPVFLACFNKKEVRIVAYIIPALVAAYSFWDYFTCEGRFCGMNNLFIIPGMGIFIAFYTLGIFVRKWSEEVLMILLWGEGVILTLLLLLTSVL